MKFFITLFVIVPSLFFAQDLSLETLQHDGIEREFLIAVPTYYDGSEAMPIVLNYHGYGSNTTQQLLYADFRGIAEREGFILVLPAGTELNGQAHWNVGGWTNDSQVDDIGFTEAMLDFLIENYNIDENRIYSTGMSNGGFMSYLLACQLSHRIAAIASVTGSMTPETFNDCNPSREMPIMQIHGTSDQTVPYDGAIFTLPIDEVMDYWININNCNSSPSFIDIPDTDMSDGCTATHIIYTDCDNGINNELFKITNGTHTWPGAFLTSVGTNQDINASEEIWKFFSRYNLQGLLSSSLNNLANSTSVNIFPNPSISNFNVFSPVDQDYKLLNLHGKELDAGFLKKGEQMLSFEWLPNGTYFLKTKTETNKIQIIRF